jgi:LPXTG-motif cell wall-anchored protein
MKLTILNNPRESVRILKKSEATDGPMENVQFALYYSMDQYNAGEDPIFTGQTSDEEGRKGILDLPALEDNHTYYLFETSTLDGYNLLEYPIIITPVSDGENYTINATYNNESLTVSKTTDTNGTIDVEVWEIVVYNSPGYELPHTGGIGTLRYTLGGIALITASAIMYGFRKRRRRKEVIM